MTSLSTLRRRAAAEQGGIIIEVIVSAALLLILVGSVLTAIDSASARSAETRHRAVAANVATAELEQLRSLKFSNLVDLNERPDATDTVGGVVYTTTTKAEWLGVPNIVAAPCAQAARSREALEVTTSVTWPNMGTAKPVTMTSLFAAPVGASAQRGAVLVQITDRDGFGVIVSPVSISGPASGSASTDANGCVKFDDLPPGDYEVTFDDPPKVERETNLSAVAAPVTVVGGQTQSLAFQYDEPVVGSTITFVTRDLDGSEKAAPQKHVAFKPYSGSTVFDPIDPASSTHTAGTDLADGTYELYAGPCAVNQNATRPSLTHPGGTAKVKVPSLRVKLEYYGDGLSDGSVWLSSPVYDSYGIVCPKIVHGPYTTGADGWTEVVGLPWLYDGFTYAICITHPGRPGYRKRGTIANQNFNGVTEVQLEGTSGAETGTCPV